MNQVTQRLKEEVTMLRSAVAGLLVRDAEGEYRPSFIAAIRKASLRKPTKTFKDPKSFLGEVDKA